MPSPLRLILASASPRRAELLRSAGFDFEVSPVHLDEDVRGAESAGVYVRRLAMEKSAAAQRAHADAIVLGADTTVVVDGRILAKPKDDDEARAMLRLLSGRAHDVLTGISLRWPGGEAHAVESTRVTFASMSGDEIAWYVATGEGRDKAGAYAIQGLASRFISSIEGSYANVVGLPVATVYRMIADVRRM